VSRRVGGGGGGGEGIKIGDLDIERQIQGSHFIYVGCMCRSSPHVLELCCIVFFVSCVLALMRSLDVHAIVWPNALAVPPAISGSSKLMTAVQVLSYAGMVFGTNMCVWAWAWARVWAWGFRSDHCRCCLCDRGHWNDAC
jgi:hypothetical protein